MICYFSGTGNTKWVAETIAKATGDRLVNMAEYHGGTHCSIVLKEDERLGFCFPTHGWQPPRLVRRFISETTFQCSPTTYVYAVTTCGDNIGETMTILNRELKKKNICAVTQFSVIMPESYVCLPFMYTDTIEREHEKIARARQQLARIVTVVKNKQTGIVELEKGATPLLLSYVIGTFFHRVLVGDRCFTVDTDACVRCGKCISACPVANIKGAPPVWKHNGQCISCLACYHYCPTHAINYGKITRKRGQYFFNRRGDQK